MTGKCRFISGGGGQRRSETPARRDSGCLSSVFAKLCLVTVAANAISPSSGSPSQTDRARAQRLVPDEAREPSGRRLLNLIAPGSTL